MQNSKTVFLVKCLGVAAYGFVFSFLLTLFGTIDDHTLASAPLLFVPKMVCLINPEDSFCKSLIQEPEKLPPVFILHGLGERTWTLSAFVWFLNAKGWDRVYTPHWPANTCLLEDCLDALDKEMQSYANKSEPILVIGNSMGGVMAYHLHTRDWNILASYSVAAPIKGSKLYSLLKANLPSWIFQYFNQAGHAYLERTEQPPPPPHPWFTVGFHLGVGFDGHVFLSDMPNTSHVSVLGSHFSLIHDPIVWNYLEMGMRKHLP
jgi:pimeloyl-ACP methyl ester carboxylesterase